MTIGVGGSTPEQELSRLRNMTEGARGIELDEFRSRLEKCRHLMRQRNIEACYINAGTSLYYFTGTRWSASERMVGAIVPSLGPVRYIAPAFEKGTLADHLQIEGEISCWQEHESPYSLLSDTLTGMGITEGRIAIDESAPFFLFDGIRQANGRFEYVSANPVSQGCRMIKSAAEIALMQCAKNMTLEVHKAAARILRPGISTTEVDAFINEAHKRVGAPAGWTFCIVLFGEATAYPHGVKDPQILEEGDMVLIDTGCQVNGYHSDITRSYVYGEATARQHEVWNLEKQAQAAAFDAARPGQGCSSVDAAARSVLEKNGFGPGYELPGLPHRTGHGIGLDIHEGPYLVKGDDTPLQTGMCFSNEPMICIPGEFGIRHEDHFYMTDTGPKWFTQPAHSVLDPFAYRN